MRRGWPAYVAAGAQRRISRTALWCGCDHGQKSGARIAATCAVLLRAQMLRGPGPAVRFKTLNIGFKTERRWHQCSPRCAPDDPHFQPLPSDHPAARLRVDKVAQTTDPRLGSGNGCSGERRPRGRALGTHTPAAQFGHEVEAGFAHTRGTHWQHPLGACIRGTHSQRVRTRHAPGADARVPWTHLGTLKWAMLAGASQDAAREFLPHAKQWLRSSCSASLFRSRKRARMCARLVPGVESSEHT